MPVRFRGFDIRIAEEQTQGLLFHELILILYYLLINIPFSAYKIIQYILILPIKRFILIFV